MPFGRCIGLGADNAPAGLTLQMCPSVVVTRSTCRLWQLTKRSKVDAPLIGHSVVPEITERHAEDSPTLAGPPHSRRPCSDLVIPHSQRCRAGANAE
jgi:hypothetical protein